MEPAMNAVTEDDLSHFCCQNKRCVAYGSKGAGNLHVVDHIGKNKNIRLLRCQTCKKRFSERKGTVFYRSHLPVEKGKGGTVIPYARVAGRHAKALHEQLVAFSPSHPGTATG